MTHPYSPREVPCLPRARVVSLLCLAFLISARAAWSEIPDLVLLPASDSTTPVCYADNGLVQVEVPNLGTIYVAPRTVDASSGKWQSTVVAKNFEPASGDKIEGSSTVEWKTEGTKAVITLRANTGPDGVRFKLSWTVEGDATGHIRTDLLIPHDIASKIQILDASEKVFWSPEKEAQGVIPLPVTFQDLANQSTILTLSSETANFGVRKDQNFEKNGIELRISPYRSGAACMLSEASEFEFFLEFAK